MITLTQETNTATADLTEAAGRVVEAYNVLARQLRSSADSPHEAPRTVGVTSCLRGEGASSVAANLAIAAAELSDRPVLLVDLNTARPAQSTYFGLTGSSGLSDALAHPRAAGEYVRATRVRNLSLLADDAAPGRDPLNLDLASVGELLQSLRADYAQIILDLPTADSTECFALAGLLDGVLLVVEAERTRSEVANLAKRRLAGAHANLLGVVLNKKPQHIPDWLYHRL